MSKTRDIQEQEEHQAKKIEIKNNNKEAFSTFYSTVLRMESQRRASFERRKKKLSGGDL